MSRLTHVKYLFACGLIGGGIVLACSTPSEAPPMAPRPDPMTPRDPVPTGPDIPSESALPGPTFPVPDAGPGPENPEPRNPVDPAPRPVPSTRGPMTIVDVPPATFAASGATPMQLTDAGVRDAAPRPDSPPPPDASTPRDARPPADALIPPPTSDAGRPRP